MRAPSPWLILALLITLCFSLATVTLPRAQLWERGGSTASLMNVLLGDSRRIFASQLFLKADVSFHSGYYPSAFDRTQAPQGSRHMTAAEGSPEEEEHERSMNFLGPPKDWIERFGRRFIITDHTHLAGNNEREILPWLKLSASLDPERIDTYTVSAYWLRKELGKVAEAEQFLREGLRNNPNSYELLFELGKLQQENYHDASRARNLWELALRRWREQQSGKKDPDNLAAEQICVRLAHLEEQAGNLRQAIGYLETAAGVSPNAAALRAQIEELKQKLRR